MHVQSQVRTGDLQDSKKSAIFFRPLLAAIDLTAVLHRISLISFHLYNAVVSYTKKRAQKPLF